MDRSLKTLGGKILVGLIAIPLLIGGAKAMFDPTALVERIGVEPSGVVGLSTIRGALGGLLMGSGAMIIGGLVRKNTEWFLAVAALMAVATLGRLVGLGLDGVDPAAVKAAVVEAVIVVVMVIAHKRL
jgi:hypothetical protein